MGSIIKSLYWRFENTLTYNKSIKENNINAVIGYVTQKSKSNNINLNAKPYESDLVHTINGATEISSWDQIVNAWSMISYFGRVNYSYRDRYLLTASIRSDGSSRFGSERRYATFPSAALAWILSEEEFLKTSDVISNLKVRFSYGKSGNNNIGDYRHLGMINTGQYSFNNDIVNATYSGLSNPFLTWEESNEFNLGVDLSLFHNRMSIVAEIYNRKTKNMLLNKEIPAITGFLSQYVNQGKVRNNGFEFSLNAKPIVGDFTWGVNFNIAINKNKVLSLNDKDAEILSGSDDGTPTHITVPGRPIGLLYGYVFEGIYTAEEIDDPDVPKHETDYPGANKYKDVNGDGVISDELDYTIIGNPHPDFTYGFSTNLSYKRINLRINLSGQYGGNVVNGLRQTVDNLQGLFNVTKEWVNRYRSPENPGDGKHYGVPKYAPSYGHRISSLWVESASFLRINNLTLGYDLPENWIKRTNFIKHFNVYLSIQNLATFTNYGGANPEAKKNKSNEALTLGYDDASYPIPRTFSMGVNLSF